MKRIIPVALSILCAPAVFAGLLVTEVTGKVEIDGKGVVATLAEVPDGARLIVPGGARLVVVDLGSGREFVLSGGGRYIVAAGGPQTAAGKAVEAMALPASNLPDVRIASGKVAQATLVMRSINTAKVPLLLSPVRTAAITATPLFRWNAVEAATSYRLMVTKPDGGMVWDIATRDTEMLLPADRALQAGGRYTWRVEAVGEGGRLSDASAGFSVAQADAIQRLARLKPEANAPFGRRVLYAALLREAGAVEAAKEIWKALAKEHPDDPVLKSMAESREAG